MKMIVKFPIDGVKRIYEHSKANPLFSPSFGQMFQAEYRKDGKAVSFDADMPKSTDVDTSKIPPQFTLVKDQGAYLMAGTEATLAGEKVANFVVYCDGCNPDVDEDYYETAREIFGGDDFGEPLPLEWMQRAIESGKEYLCLKVTEENIELVL